MTEYGETCSSIHMASITDEDECKDVAKNYSLMFLGRERGLPNVPFVPTGCYFYVIENSAYWNPDQWDAGNSDVKAICKQGIFNHIQSRQYVRLNL